MPNRKIPRTEGSIEFRVEGQVFYATVKGAPNLKTFLNIHPRARAVWDELNTQGPWGSVVSLDNSLLISPEIFNKLKVLAVSRAPQSRLVAVGWALPPSLPGHDVLKPLYEGFYKEWWPSAAFPDEPSALQWVSEQLTTTESSVGAQPRMAGA